MAFHDVQDHRVQWVASRAGQSLKLATGPIGCCVIVALRGTDLLVTGRPGKLGCWQLYGWNITTDLSKMISLLRTMS